MIATAAPVCLREGAFWTSRQRQAHSLHEVPYRACFKPQLPRHFIDRYTSPGEAVYDPFLGRGTTLLEAALAGRVPMGTDVNPLSRMLLAPRLDPPTAEEVADRLAEIDWSAAAPPDVEEEDLLVFYHPETLRRIRALRLHLARPALDRADAWIRMVALTRLTGHSAGFFSVYTLPPNQAVSAASQRKINAKRGQSPPPRDVAKLVEKKSRALLADLDASTRARLAAVRPAAILSCAPARAVPQIPSETAALAVTSPPFLDVVDYAGDNRLRCWFAGIDPTSVPITRERTIEGWSAEMEAAIRETARILVPGGRLAFEVGEVRGGKVNLEEYILPLGARAGLTLREVLVHRQRFTKTANCWGVSNNAKGTNSHRIVLFEKTI